MASPMVATRSDWLSGTAATLRPPPKLTLSQWADEHFRLSGGSADAGRWHTRPYQRGIMDAITDPAVSRVSVMKSARIGWTQMMNAAIAYFMHQDPCPILVVQPTVDTAEIYSREMIAPMLRDVPVLAGLVGGSAVKTTGRTLLHKTFPGGVLSLVGANSGAGFAMIDRRIAAFDEVDRYPPSAGDEGDPIALGEKRTETYWNRKIIGGSTPLIAGSSRIEEMFWAGDQRRRYWPCPHCGHFDFLAFNEQAERGHVMKWPPDRPDLAFFECRTCGCSIEETSKRDMDEAGEWRADTEFTGHASFQVWSAYSTSPNASWGQIASEFVAAKKLGPEKLRTVVNTTLGETWAERGDAPDWERLYQRREPYAIGTVPAGAIVLTCGVDVQKDRLVPEVVAWGANKESWSIEIGELHGDTALTTGDGSPWVKLDALLAREFPGADGRMFTIAMMAVDSGAFTQTVYSWCRGKPISRVIACKGVPGSMRALVDAPSKVDVTTHGKRLQRGYKVWPVGVDIAKGELYGWLQMERGDGDPPPGWCHFPEHGERFFRQLTAEHLISIVNKKTRRTKREWHVKPNEENHYLDARILARAAAAVLGIDRMKPAAQAPAPAPAAQQQETGEQPPPSHAPGNPKRSGFWEGRQRGGASSGKWLSRRR
jgi:phage terminase large subunit GpA-like protein